MDRVPDLRISKLDAARTQLDCAIELWFNNADAMSVHTLAAASHQIIHDINVKKGGRDLIFDSLVIKDEYREQYNRFMKRPANFAKHANNDPDGMIEFNPLISEQFLLFSSYGLLHLTGSLSAAANCFVTWFLILNPRCILPSGRKAFEDLWPADKIKGVKALGKAEFFRVWMESGRNAGR